MDLSKELAALTESENHDFSATWASFLDKLYRYRLLFRRRWWVLLLTGSLGLGAAAWWASAQPSLFSSVARMMVSGKVSIPDGAAYNEELANFFGTQVELMSSGEVRRRAQERVQALHPEIVPVPVKLEVAQLRGAAIFIFTATCTDPYYAPLYLDACMEEYINSKREIRSEKSETTVTAITGELVRLEKDLRDGEQELLDFQKRNNVGFLQEEGNSAATYLVTLNRQIAGLRTEYDLLNLLDVDQNLDRVMKNGTEKSAGADGSTGSVLSDFGPEAEYLKAKQQVELLKAQREDFTKVLRPAHPTMIQLQEDIAKYETLINTFRTQSVQQLKTRRESIALQLQNLEEVAKEWEAKALDLGQRIAEYQRMKSKVDRNKAVYDHLLTSLRNVDVTQRIDQDLVSILEKASPAISMRPGILKAALIGVSAGLAVGACIFILLELIDDRITSFQQIQEHFRDRVLAQISHENTSGTNISPLVIDGERHALAESFRALRSSIHYLPDSIKSPKTVLVTSAAPNEGKSFVASNLALTLAFGESRVLLIDADVRRGMLHQIFNLSNQCGLSDVLKGKAKAVECLHATRFARLDLLSRGSNLDRPGDYFLGHAIDEVINEVRPLYDYIVLDTAPVMAADDTSSLAPKADACIYVVRFAFSAARVSGKGLKILKDRGAAILGLVCNEMHRGMPEYYYHYQYADYYESNAHADV